MLRPVGDVYHIMARADQQADVEMEEPDPTPHQIPRLGLLSKTVLPSPFIKFIIPAKIRRKRVNDLVFIGEDFVRLVEIQAKGHVHHVASKSDFKGRILAARVFGEPRDFERIGQFGTPIKQKDVNATRRSNPSEEADVIPPELIVLTLSSLTLMMLWAVQLPSGKVTFRHAKVRLAQGISSNDRAGSFLAVDPRCRAIAVGTTEGQFTLYKTRSLDAWREEVRAGREGTPIEDERHMVLQGRIIHMEFLSPGVDKDDPHVILLFVLAQKGKTKITCYDWDVRQSLSTMAVRAERVSVDYGKSAFLDVFLGMVVFPCRIDTLLTLTEDHNPALLIPANRSPDFMLVCGGHIATYTNVLSGLPQRHNTLIPSDILRTLHPGENRNRPVWVQWERVPRNPDFSKEVFYIAREDGVLIYAELLLSNLVDINHVGEWPYPLDRAFASLDVDVGGFNSMNGDVLIAAGTSSDGLVQKVGPWVTEALNVPYRHTLDPVVSIPNWTPVSDFLVSKLPGTRFPIQRERYSMYVASGRAQQGSILELRHGIKAVVDEYVEESASYTNLWIMDHRSEKVKEEGKEFYRHSVVFLLALPLESLAVRASYVQGVWGLDQLPTGNDESGKGSIATGETISAGSLSEQLSVQITRKDARILLCPTMTCVDSLSVDSLTQGRTPASSDFILAAVAADPYPHIAVAYREEGFMIIQIIPIARNGGFSKAIRHNLSIEPTCIDLLDVDGVPHLFVGGTDGTLAIYRIHQQGVLEGVFEYRTNPQVTDLSSMMPMVCESVVFLASGDRRLLVCGMRNGTLLSFPFHKGSTSK